MPNPSPTRRARCQCQHVKALHTKMVCLVKNCLCVGFVKATCATWKCARRVTRRYRLDDWCEKDYRRVKRVHLRKRC